MMDESSMESSECGNENEFPGKNKCVSIGVILTVVSASMALGSIFLMTLITQTQIRELYLVYFRHNLNEETRSAFLVLVGIMIALSFIQLIANISFTSAAIMENTGLIYRYNTRYTITNVLAASAFWVLVMAMLASCPHNHSAYLLWAVLFLGGMTQSSTIIFLFQGIETQKEKLIEKAKLVADRENSMTKSYLKFDNSRAVM